MRLQGHKYLEKTLTITENTPLYSLLKIRSVYIIFEYQPRKSKIYSIPLKIGNIINMVSSQNSIAVGCLMLMETK